MLQYFVVTTDSHCLFQSLLPPKDNYFSLGATENMNDVWKQLCPQLGIKSDLRRKWPYDALQERISFVCRGLPDTLIGLNPLNLAHIQYVLNTSQQVQTPWHNWHTYSHQQKPPNDNIATFSLVSPASFSFSMEWH